MARCFIIAVSLGWSCSFVSADEPALTAFLCGPSDYANLTRLNFSDDDAVAIQQTLKKKAGIPDERLLIFTDKDGYKPPTASVLREDLKDWLKSRRPSDTAFFFFSGHAFASAEGKVFLCPSDVDPRRLEETSLALSDLREWMAKCPARLKVAILDACHSGSAKNAGVLPLTRVEGEDLLQAFQGATNLAVFASSTGDQESIEANGHGIYTKVLLEVLSGAAGNDRAPFTEVSLTEIQDHLDARVKVEAAVLGHTQTPVSNQFGIANPPPVVVFRSAPLPKLFTALPKLIQNVPADHVPGLIAPFVRHTSRVGSVDFHGTRNLALSSSSDRTAIVWDLDQKTFVHRETILSTSNVGSHTRSRFSSDGNLIATTRQDERNVIIWSPQHLRGPKHILKARSSTRDAVLTPDGENLVVGLENGQIHFFQTPTPDSFEKSSWTTAHLAAINVLCLTPDSRLLIAASSDGVVRAHDCQNGGYIRDFPGLETDDRDAFVAWLKISRDGEWLIGAGYQPKAKTLAVRAWQIDTGKVVHEQTIGSLVSQNVRIVDFSNDFRTALTGGEDGQVSLWDIRSGEQLWSLKAHRKRVTCVALSEDGLYALSGSDDFSVSYLGLPPYTGQ